VTPEKLTVYVPAGTFNRVTGYGSVVGKPAIEGLIENVALDKFESTLMVPVGGDVTVRDTVIDFGLFDAADDTIEICPL